MLKHLTKLAMEIVPSVVATILGAYIVNHYINAKPDTPAAAVAAAAPTAAAHSSKIDAGRAGGLKADAKPAETSAAISSAPVAGIRAKGIAEKATSDKPASDKPAAAEKPAEAKSETKPETKSDAKPESKPAETASLPADKAHAVTPKPMARPAEAEDHRDAADLARAAIERLRASEGPRSSEAARAPAEPPRIVTAAPQVSPVRPLPPAIAVSTPSVEGAPYAVGTPPYTGTLQTDGRLTPPGEIPTPPPARPLDLRADRGGDPTLKDQVSNVAQDMVSAARSVFHSVLPK
jgi:hypothetical protein